MSRRKLDRVQVLSDARAELQRRASGTGAEDEIMRRAAQLVIDASGDVTLPEAVGHVLSSDADLASRYIQERLQPRQQPLYWSLRHATLFTGGTRETLP